MNRLLKFFTSCWVFFVFLFLYLPIVVLVAFSFNTKSFPSPFEHFTFHWYYALFNTPQLWSSFFNSLIVSVSSTCISLTLGLMMICLHIYGSRIQRMIPLF